MLSLDQLDASIAALDAAAGVDHQTLHQGLGSLSLDYAAFSAGPGDPTGAAYRDWQLSIYQQISRRSYDLSNEAIEFDLLAAARRPYPYSTQNRATIGSHLKMLGFFLENFDVRSGGRVLEMGAGWGNMALALADCGYQVSACDLERRFVELIGLRAQAAGHAIDVWEGNFLQPEHYDERWDAIVFNACFHHCDDHQRLLDLIVSRTRADVRLVFAGESVYPYYPWPWGMNLTGQAVYCIRKFGWLELAFNEAYFLRELMRRGVFVRKSVACFDQNLTILVGRKFAPLVGQKLPFGEITLLPDDEASFEKEDSATISGRFTGGRSTITLVDHNIKRFTFSVLNPKPVPTSFSLTHGGRVQQATLPPGGTMEISVENYDGGTCLIEAETHQPSQIGLNSDDRHLGIYLESVTIDRLLTI